MSDHQLGSLRRKLAEFYWSFNACGLWDYKFRARHQPKQNDEQKRESCLKMSVPNRPMALSGSGGTCAASGILNPHQVTT